MRRRLVSLACVAVSLVAVSCGSGGGEQPATEDGLKQAAKASTEALIAGDGEASYEFLSAECKQRWGVGDWSANVQAGLLLAQGFGVDLGEATAGEVKVRNVTLTSGEASVDIVTASGDPLFGEQSGESFNEWVYEDGAWRTSGCSAVGASSDSGSSSSATAAPLEHEDLVIEETGFALIPGSSDTSTYAVIVHNPNSDVLAEGVELTLTFTDASGGVIKSQDELIPVVLPGGDAAIANGIQVTDAVKLDVQLDVREWSDAPESVGEFSVTNTTKRDQEYLGTDMSGNVVSTWSEPTDVRVMALLRDEAGVLQGGTFDYIYDLPANGQKSFTISTMNKVPTNWIPDYVVNLQTLP